MKLETAVQKVIRDWLEGGKNRSLKSMSRKTGLSYPTVRRIERAEGQPQHASVIKILEVALGSAERIQNFLLEFMPEYVPVVAEKAKIGLGYISARSNSPVHVSIFRELGFGSRAIDSLVEKFGPSTAAAVSDLIADGLAIQEEGVVKSTEVRVTNVDFTREAIHQMADHLDFNLPGNEGDFAHLDLNLAGAQAIHEAVCELKLKLAKIRANSDYQGGSKKVAFSVLMTMY